MPKKVNTKIEREELIEALQDDEVWKGLAALLKGTITTVVDEAIKAHLAKLNETLKETIEQMSRNLIEAKLEPLREEINQLKMQNGQLLTRLDDLETYSRAEHLVVYGLPELTLAEISSNSNSSYESSDATCGAVVALCRDRLGIQLANQDISVAHRIQAGKKCKIRPIVVRFVARRIRDQVYRARIALRELDEKIYINEQLTKKAADIFFNARKLLRNKKIAGTWTMHGQVYIKRTSSAGEKPTRIDVISDLPKDD